MRITTERLVLREFVAEDWRAVESYLADQRYWRYYEPPGSDISPENPYDLPENPDDATATAPGSTDRRELVTQFLTWQKATPRRRFQFAITLGDTKPQPNPSDVALHGSVGQLIGSTGLRQRRLVDFGNPAATFEADLGYELDPAFWGRGYATEAVRALIDFGFGELNLHRIWAYCLDENQPSWRVLERLGFRLEGRLRENEFMRGRWWDSRVYGLLAAEWQVLRP